MKTNFILVYFNCTKLALLLAMVALSLAGCMRDELHFPETSGETVAINLNFPGMTLTRAGDGRAIDDQTIEHVRVFAFERNTGGRCRLNHFVKQLPAPFWFELSANSYDFHFVINEPLGAGGVQNTALDAVKTLADLHAFNVPTANLIDAEGRYMMCGSQSDVKVEANYLRPTDQTHPGTYHYHAMVSYTGTDGTNHTRVETLNIEAFRLATKVNLRLVNKDALDVTLPYADFADVKITNLPASVPVIAGVNSPQPAVSEITLGRAIIEKHPANGTYEGYTAIIPSYILAANADKANAAILSVTMAGDANPRTMAIGHDIVPDAVAGTTGVDYNLYRNTIYHILGKVVAGLELDIKVADWHVVEEDLDLGDIPVIPPPPTPDNYQVLEYFYAGTFHRSGETGERIIQQHRPDGNNYRGWWQAIVTEGAEWILLDNVVNTTLPATGHPEDANKQLKNSSSAASSLINQSGLIAFRVGLKTKNPNPVSTEYPNGKPRYGIIQLYTKTDDGQLHSHKIHVRQGEDADYLFSPGELRSDGAQVDQNRAFARKYLPYNLKTPGVLVDYPSQHGGWFNWNSPNYYVYKGVSLLAAGEALTTSPREWDNAKETCPAGYRHPKRVTEREIANAEDRQSLVQDPPSDHTSQTYKNISEGYYADGYFDRQILGSSISFINGEQNEVTAPNSRVGGNDLGQAFQGAVIYNPTTSASLFFPAGGRIYNFNSTPAYYSVTQFGFVQANCDDTYINATVFTLTVLSATSGVLKPSIHSYGSFKYAMFAVRCVKQ